MEALSEFGPWIGPLLDGVATTLLVTAVAALGALIVALAFGLLSLAPGRAPRFVSRLFVEFFRGTSLFVQLFWLFFVLPQLGYSLDAFTVAVLAFSLNFGAYGAEVVRGAINAVPKPQWEATVALNMSRYQRMRRVIFPQAVVAMIPPFNNLLIQLLKSTPLVYTITVFDMMAVTQSYRASEGNTLFIFSLVLVLYFVFAYALTLGMQFLERRAKARIGQGEARRRLLARRPIVQGEAQ